MRNYDLIVIGSGPAGEKGAAQAAYFGKTVALIEKEPAPGGAGVNTGTIPSKTLRESALHLSGLKQRGLSGVNVSIRPDISVGDFMYHERAVVEKAWELIDDNMSRHGVDVYRGVAHFQSAHEVAVDLGTSHIVLHGQNILIATGSAPHHPETVPFDGRSIYDSDTILNLDRIPKTMAVVGAGVIGCEYACIFAALGVDVALVDGRIELLSHIDQEVSDVLLRQMRNRLKIQLYLGEDVESVEPNSATGDASCVCLKLKNGKQMLVEKVLYAAGRQSNTALLNLEAVGVKTGKRGVIEVNEYYQTSVPHIYAAGDVIGFPALASTSMEQGRIAAVHAFNLEHKTRLASIFPYCIWTIPEVAVVGLNEEECLAKGIEYEVGRAYYRNNSRGQIVGDTGGLLKLIFSPADRKIIGVHIVGESASELVHIGLMVMEMGGTIDRFIDTVFNYPTLGDMYKYAAYDGLARLARRERCSVQNADGQSNSNGSLRPPDNLPKLPI
ncbi:MAG TPA: Si-specific NAD(P)(+) transhydrogenase [Abditibacteriaceae bacterium]|jgi:NAD(P) transhydrogenase